MSECVLIVDYWGVSAGVSVVQCNAVLCVVSRTNLSLACMYVCSGHLSSRVVSRGQAWSGTNCMNLSHTQPHGPTPRLRTGVPPAILSERSIGTRTCAVSALFAVSPDHSIAVML